MELSGQSVRDRTWRAEVFWPDCPDPEQLVRGSAAKQVKNQKGGADGNRGCRRRCGERNK